jgi:hypothetical protein
MGEVEDENEILLNEVNSMSEISEETRKNADKLSEKIMNFKKLLFNTIITNDKEYSPEDLKPLSIYYELFYQAINFWLGILNRQPGNIEPSFEKKTIIHTNFKNLTKQILEYSNYDSDAPILIQSKLLKFSNQHPYIFNF